MSSKGINKSSMCPKLYIIRDTWHKLSAASEKRLTRTFFHDHLVIICYTLFIG